MTMTAKTFPRLLSKKKIIMVIIVVILIFNLHLYKKESSIKGVAPKVFSLLPSEGDKVLVTYAYAEGLGNGGEIDRHNLHYFIRVGIAGLVPGTSDPNSKVDYIIVVSGWKCELCETSLKEVLIRPELKSKGKDWVTLLYRENRGMDFGAYNMSITWVNQHRPTIYKYFIFINSSLRGPFMPKWTPNTFHFTDALTQMMKDDSRIKIVGSYITCLSKAFEPFQRVVMESLFFCLDEDSLRWVIEDGVFNIRDKKTDIALLGEYGLMNSVIRRGWRAESLSMRYAKGLDWASSVHENCNDNRHSSRRGILDGEISPNLLEHIFVKTSWCVRAKESGVLSRWLLKLSQGEPGTSGEPDMAGWKYGVSEFGTSSKKGGTLRPDIPSDGCEHGDIRELIVNKY